MAVKGNPNGPKAPVPSEAPLNGGKGKPIKPATEGTAGKGLDPKRFPKA